MEKCRSKQIECTQELQTMVEEYENIFDNVKNQLSGRTIELIGSSIKQMIKFCTDSERSIKARLKGENSLKKLFNRKASISAESKATADALLKRLSEFHSLLVRQNQLVEMGRYAGKTGKGNETKGSRMKYNLLYQYLLQRYNSLSSDVAAFAK